MTTAVEEIRDRLGNINTDEELVEIETLLEEVEDPFREQPLLPGEPHGHRHLARQALRHGVITDYSITTDESFGYETTGRVEVDLTFICEPEVLNEL